MFSPLRPGQRLSHLLRAAGTAPIPKPRQGDGVPLTRDDRTADRQGGRTGEVGQPLGPLHVHLLQGLLPGLERGRARVEPRCPRPQGGPQRPPLGCPTKRRAQQTTGVQVRKPLAIRASALAPRYMRDGRRVDEGDLAAPRLQALGEGTPLHPGRFHRHRLTPVGGQPVRQRVQVGGTGPKWPHRLRVTVVGPTRPALLTANVHTSRVGVAPGQRQRKARMWGGGYAWRSLRRQGESWPSDPVRTAQANQRNGGSAQPERRRQA
jgi:hypothetical protein